MAVRREGNEGEIQVKLVIGVRIGLDAWAALVAQRASLKAPVATSQLAQSITYVVESFPELLAAWRAIVGTNIEYAAAQEFGSGIHDPDQPHTITIEAGFWTGKSNKKSLAFGWPNAPAGMEPDPDTGLFFFRSVQHPGVRAQPYLRPALRETEEEGRSLLLQAIVTELSKQ